MIIIFVGLGIFLYYFYKDKNFKQKNTISQFKHDLQKYKYLISRNTYLTTKSESIFLRNLLQYVEGKNYIVCPKFRIGDIITVRNGKKGFRPYVITSRIDRSHVDFVLLRKDDMSIFCVIELDDPTHQKESAYEKDEVKNVIFKFLNIPILRFQKTYTTDQESHDAGIL